MKANKKKVIVLCSMVALLVVTCTLNFVLNSKLNDSTGTTDVNGGVTETFFTKERSSRESARAQQFSYLDAIISSGDEAAVASAKEMKLELCAAIEKEVALESLIKARGFDEAIVTMSTDNINVIVKAGDFTAEHAGKILGVILSETSYTAKEVAIYPYNV